MGSGRFGSFVAGGRVWSVGIFSLSVREGGGGVWELLIRRVTEVETSGKGELEVCRQEGTVEEGRGSREEESQFFWTVGDSAGLVSGNKGGEAIKEVTVGVTSGGGALGVGG